MFLSRNKQQTVKICDQSLDLKVTKDLYGRLMVLAKSNRSEESNWELWIQSDSQGTVCSRWIHSSRVRASQSLLIVWKSCGKTREQIKMHNYHHRRIMSKPFIDEPDTSIAASPKIAIVDGMLLVQQITKKSGTISIVKSLSQHLNDTLLTLTEDFD